MFRTAILETEEITKELIFAMTVALPKEELLFRYFTKISQFALEEEKKEFQILVLHEKFEIPRITQSFILNKPNRIVLYTKTHVTQEEMEILPFARIFYINRKHIRTEIARISSAIEFMISNQDAYIFSYNNVNVTLKVSDILYIEKQDKYLIYHTKRGEFRERKNMKDAEAYFREYHFLWVHASYLVNMQFITCIEHDVIYLKKLQLPVSRSRKALVTEQLRAFIKG